MPILRRYLRADDAAKPVAPVLAGLETVLQDFIDDKLKPLGVRAFARGGSQTNGPGMVNCGCGPMGKCISCKCAKSGRRCNSSCKCSRFSMCKNIEPA